MKLKNIIKGTGKGFWFGNGRFMGIQVGSVEKRLSDPYYSDVSLINHYWSRGQFKPYLSKDGAHQIIDSLSSKLNKGTADSKLIPKLNKIGNPDYMVDEEAFKEWIKNPLTLYHLFHIQILDA